jgi:hypothetical protein
VVLLPGVDLSIRKVALSIAFGNSIDKVALRLAKCNQLQNLEATPQRIDFTFDFDLLTEMPMRRRPCERIN